MSQRPYFVKRLLNKGYTMLRSLFSCFLILFRLIDSGHILTIRLEQRFQRLEGLRGLIALMVVGNRISVE